MVDGSAANLIRTLGVVGGMGPIATVKFLENIYASEKVDNEVDHVRIVADINPRIPSRTRSILWDGEDFVPHIVESAEKLSRAGANLISIPCNSAQQKLDQIQANLPIPIVSIFDSVAAKLPPKAEKVLVLGGPVTFQKRTYLSHIERTGRTYVSPTLVLQETVERIIYASKIAATEKQDVEEIRGILESGYSSGAFDCIVLACTELATLNLSAFEHLPILDSSLAYAEYSLYQIRSLP